MNSSERKHHWEQIYNTKNHTDVSWYQPIPEPSLRMIEYFSLPIHANIIDIGGGDSLFVDHLLEKGYRNITVLDISQTAIDRAQQRLGKKADHVQWIVSDIMDFQPIEHYDVWHDRAAFHFLTDKKDIAHYTITAARSIAPNGVVIIGTFSEQGPKKCSGIDITQYSEVSITEKFKHGLEKIYCFTHEHHTPFNTVQHFIFCGFKKLSL